MNLNSAPNLRVEDFPDQQGWIGRLFIQVNPFIQAVNSVLTNRIDYTTNIKAVTYTNTMTSFQQFSFKWTFTDASPSDVRVIQALKGTSQAPTILIPAWSFDATSRSITISRLVEVLDSSVSTLSGSYKITLRATV